MFNKNAFRTTLIFLSIILLVVIMNLFLTGDTLVVF